ncbi:MAG: hypothetical protein M3470_04205, partial [Chloroflexota bacterium]|nr:hypothetical protein [Chloroflexota bacterium]
MIAVKDLRKHYKDVRAVDGITLSVAEGEVFGLARSLGGIERLCALDQLGDLLSALAPDPLKVAGAVLFGHGLP